MRLAQLLAERDEAAARDPRSPVLCSTIFQRDDVVVRLVDVRGDLHEGDPAVTLGLPDPGRVSELTTLLDGFTDAGSPTGGGLVRALEGAGWSWSRTGAPDA